MAEFKNTKKWSRKAKILQAIILGSLGNNMFFEADDDDNDGIDHACECNNEEIKNQSSSLFSKLGFLPSLAMVVPSKGLNGLKKFGRAVSMRKNEKQTSVELCKKRIIMGKKCRPLNVSGALHYDKNGVLVPELLFSPYHDSIV